MLPTIPARELPALAYAHGPEHDPALTSPEHFRPIPQDEHHVKPLAGGLWTAPVTRRHPGGGIASTAWTDWCADEMPSVAENALFVPIQPAPDARVLYVGSLADLEAVTAAYPVDQFGMRFPDWNRLAGNWDAFYLTQTGMWETRFTRPNLYSWDCATVLWLRPAYTTPAVTA